MAPTIVSENYFKYDTSDYAKALRARFGNDGYEKYYTKMNSIMENPIAKHKKEYQEEKRLQYEQAIAKTKKTSNTWFGLHTTKQEAFAKKDNNAILAFKNYQQAIADRDFALSLYNDATHSGMQYLS